MPSEKGQDATEKPASLHDGKYPILPHGKASRSPHSAPHSLPTRNACRGKVARSGNKIGKKDSGNYRRKCIRGRHWEMEEIVDERDENGETLYLIKWRKTMETPKNFNKLKGIWRPVETEEVKQFGNRRLLVTWGLTWEPRRNLGDIRELINIQDAKRLMQASHRKEVGFTDIDGGDTK